MFQMSRESLQNRKKRISQIISILKLEYPDSKCSLVYESPFQLLVATILSAQCTDERVNKVTNKKIIEIILPIKIEIIYFNIKVNLFLRKKIIGNVMIF